MFGILYDIAIVIRFHRLNLRATSVQNWFPKHRFNNNAIIKEICTLRFPGFPNSNEGHEAVAPHALRMKSI